MLELIDQGGMGKVYRARDLTTGQTIAIKELKSDFAADPQIVARFAREAETLRKLEHSNIVKVLETVNVCDQRDIVMEFIGGGSLADLLRTHPRLPVRRALEIALPLADALTRVHGAKIIHRDIKPENVLLTEDGTPRLTDFGVALLGDHPQVTQAGTLVGTFAYLSPEACRGEPLDVRADIWSFGVLLYEILAGRRPFDSSESHVVLTAILNNPIPPISQFRPDLPESLVELIGRMLTKEHDQRLPSVRHIGVAIETLLQDAGVGTAAPPAQPSQSLDAPAAPRSVMIDHAATGETIQVPPAPIDAAERDHLHALLETHRRNLRELELQEAQHGGIDVPLFLKNQLAHEHEEIAKLEAQLGIQRLRTREVVESTLVEEQPHPAVTAPIGTVLVDPPVASATPIESAPSATSAGAALSSSEQVPANTVTFLFTDIEGSTGLWERNL